MPDAILSEISSLKERVKAKVASPAEKLRLRRLQLDLEEQRLAAKAEKISKQRRAEETRIKIILGSWILHNRTRAEFRHLLSNSLEGFLSTRDRALLDDIISQSKMPALE